MVPLQPAPAQPAPEPPAALPASPLVSCWRNPSTHAVLSALSPSQTSKRQFCLSVSHNTHDEQPVQHA